MKKGMIVLIIVLLIGLIIFFAKNDIKFSKNGNNMSNKSADEIEEYILNMNSYSAKAEITVNSNKNTNKYLIEEQYTNQDNVYKKEVLEPENISRNYIYI